MCDCKQVINDGVLDLTLMKKICSLFSLLSVAIAPAVVQAQTFDLDALPTKNYQSYPAEIPDKKWTSLFFQASRLYERSQALQYENQAFSEAMDLASDGRIYGWYKEELDNGDEHSLIRTDIQSCLRNSTSHSVVFVEMWDGRNLVNRRRPYTYERVEALAITEICEAAIAEHKERI